MTSDQNLPTDAKHQNAAPPDTKTPVSKASAPKTAKPAVAKTPATKAAVAKAPADKPKAAAKPAAGTKPKAPAKNDAAKSAKPAATKPAKPKAAPAKTPVSAASKPAVADNQQAAKQQAAAEKARQAKAKLAKIAASKAKAQQAVPEPTPEPETKAQVTDTSSGTTLTQEQDVRIEGADLPIINRRRAAPASSSASAPATGLQRLRQQLPHYIRLMRLDKPIGTLLLLWPTLWALWLAAKGTPSLKNLVIFSLGVLLMRSAGCVINDFADRKIDGRVARTNQRPLATGAVTSREALILFVVLCLTAFALVLCTDALTIKLSFGGLLLAASYPFMKRHTHLPQVVLGAAFAWGVPMAYAAEIGKLDKNMWVIYFAVVLWTVAYDTFYAMVDRNDDLKIGVKSTAILFGEQDRVITGTLQAMVIYAMVLVGKAAELGWFFYLSLAVAAGLFIYQQVLIRYREREACFKAFLNNNWVGAVIFVGIAGDLALK